MSATMHAGTCTPWDPCTRCERIAERRAEGTDEVEHPDAFGRDADWNWPRSFGGGEVVPW